MSLLDEVEAEFGLTPSKQPTSLLEQVEMDYGLGVDPVPPAQESPSYASRVGTAAGLGLQNLAAGARYGIEQTAATPVAVAAGTADATANIARMTGPMGVSPQAILTGAQAAMAQPGSLLERAQAGADAILGMLKPQPISGAIQAVAPGAMEFGLPGAQAYADETRAAIQQTNQQLEANKADGGGLLLDATTGLAQMAPAVGVGLATRSPAATAAALAGPMYGQTLAEGETGPAYVTPSAAQPAGLIEQGNIDINARPTVKLPGGGIATVNSMSFQAEKGGPEILIPQVSDDGRMLTPQEAIKEYERTGKHLGKFRTPDEATAYAQTLHEDQDKQYNGKGQDVARRAGRAAAFTGAEFVTELPVAKLLTVPLKAIVNETGQAGLRTALGRIGATAGKEFTQEAQTSVLQDLYDRGALDEDKSLGDMLADAGYAGLVGGIAGGVAGAPAAVATARQDSKATADAGKARAAYEATFTETDDGQGGTTFVDGAGLPVGNTLDEARAHAARMTPQEIAGRMAQVQPVPAPGQPDLRLGAPEAQPKPNVSALPPGYMEAAAQPPLEPLRTPTAADTQMPGEGTISDAELAGAGVDTSELGQLERPSYVAPGKSEIPARDLKDAAEREPTLPALEPVRAPVETQPAITDAELTAAGVDTAALGDVAAPTAEAKAAPAKVEGVPRPTNVQADTFDVNGEPAEIRKLYDVKGGVRIKNGLRFPKKLLPEFEQRAEEIAAAPPVDTSALGEVAPLEPSNDAGVRQPSPDMAAGRPGSAVRLSGGSEADGNPPAVGSGPNMGRVPGEPDAESGTVGDAARGSAEAPALAAGRQPDATLNKRSPLLRGPAAQPAAAPTQEQRNDEVQAQQGKPDVAGAGEGQVRGEQAQAQEEVGFTPTRSETWDDGTVVDFGPSPFPQLPRKVERPTGRDKPTEATVNISELHSTQREITRQGLEKQRDDSFGLPFVVRSNGVLYIQDGHHRLAAQKFAGDTEARVRLVDLDAKEKPPAEFAAAEGETAPDAAVAPSDVWKGKKGAARLQALVAKSKDVPADAYEDARLPGYMGEAVDAMARLFKKDVVVFRAKEGTTYAPGGLLFPADPSTIYLNADANVAPAVVFMHEMVHSMKRTDPKTYAALEKAVGKLLKNKKGYVEKRLRGKKLSDELVTEEMIADVMADHASTPQFWSDLYARFDDKNAWAKFVDYVRSLMSNVIDTLYPIGANNYISDFNAAYQAVVDAAYNHARAQHGGVASDGQAMEMPAGSQTDTPEFKKWFGDSKVVDADGKPLVVYHGTNADFSEFKVDDGRVSGQELGRGFYFGPAGDASQYSGESAGSNVVPAYLSIQNPLIESDAPLNVAPLRSIKGFTEAADVVAQDTGALTTSNLREIANAMAATQGRNFGDVYREMAEALGHDGVGYNYGNGEFQYVAFRPEQIKSAIGNRGTFDPNSPDILESAQLPQTDASRALAALRGADPSLYGRAKKLWKQGFFPGGLLRGDIAKRNFERQSKIAGISYEAGNAVGNLERAVKDAYGKEFAKLSEADMRDIQAALTGKVPENMPAQVKQAVVAMRQMIDRLSRDYIQILREQIAVKLASDQDVTNDVRLLNTITNNLESYAYRSYKAFDDPNWWKTVKPDVVERAVNFIADGYVAQGMTRADAVTRANQRVAEFKTGTAADSMESFVKESKLGAKDLSVLMRRKDIPIPIRDLLGEYVDPRINFTKSIAKMGRLVQNQRFLEAVRNMGMGSLLWEKGDLSRPAEARTPVAAEGADTYSPLNGLLTTEEFAEALKDATAKPQIEGLYKWAVGANAMVNYGKTVLSPTTQVRNFLSAALFTVANGHFNYARLAEATNAVKARFGGTDKRAAAQKYIKELIDLGVLHDNANAGDFQTYLQSSGVERLFDPDTVVGKTNAVAKGLYQFSDDFWKIVGYENELAAQKRAGLSDEAAKEEAAQRIRNTYPTYSMGGKAIKALARSPVAGAFPTFSAEIVRNSYHIIRYAVTDMKEGMRTGNRAQALNGARRLAGIALMASAVYMLQAYSANSIGLDDDEEEALRSLMPPWQQNSNMLWLKRDEYGRPTYMDMSWMDVYGIWKRPLNAIMRDQPLDEAFKQAAIEFLSPFLGADILIQAVVEAGMNKKFGTGAPVYSEATKEEDIANHIRKAVQPGIAGNVERIYRASEGQTKPGGVGEYSMGEEALALAGLRVSSVDPALGLRSRGYDFSEATRDSGQALRRILSSPNEVSEAEIDAQAEAAIKLHEEAYERTRRTVEAAMKSGLSANQALRILDGSGISKKRAQALVQGRSMPFELSDRALKDALDRAAAIPGRKDNRAEIKKRYNYAERRLKELQRKQ